jgi:hypothetical protein
MHGFLSFRKFFTPELIHVLFWIGIGVCVLRGITQMATAAAYHQALGIVEGLIVFFVGPIVVRVVCEILIAVFQMHESITTRDRL